MITTGKPRDAIRHCGLLGHEFILVRYSLADRGWFRRGECNSLQRAIQWGEEGTTPFAVFQRCGKEWKQVEYRNNPKG